MHVHVRNKRFYLLGIKHKFHSVLKKMVNLDQCDINDCAIESVLLQQCVPAGSYIYYNENIPNIYVVDTQTTVIFCISLAPAWWPPWWFTIYPSTDGIDT